LISQPEHTVIISPIGDFQAPLLRQMGREINRIFALDTEIIPLIEDVGFALDSDRDQYYSTSILERLEHLAPEHAIKILGLAKVDLFIPILTHVYGEARLGGKAAIVSTHRLREGLSPLTSRQAFHHRTAKEAIHELGHTFNLRHCQDHACIMHYCRTVQDVDKKSDQLCRYCTLLLKDEMDRLSRG
jgi:archaemetzincin